MTSQTTPGPTLPDQRGDERRAPGRPTWLHTEATIAWRLIVMVGAGLLALWLMLQVTVIAIAVFVAFAQAALLWPVVGWLSRFMPRVLASMLAVLAYAASIVALGYFIVVQIVNSWPEMSEALVGSVQAANQWLEDQGWAITPEVFDTALSELESMAGDLVSGLGGAAMSTLSFLGSAGTVLVVSLFATLFALIGGRTMTEGLVSMVPERRQLSTFAALRDMATTARWWTFASAVTGAVDGILIGLGLWVLDVPLAVPIGVATFILAFIPMIGATVAGAIAVAVALFFGGLDTAVWALVIVLAVQQIEGNVLAPLLLSRAMRFPPLLTLLLSTGGGVAIGVTGLFLAVPVAGILTAAVKGWRRELPDDVRAAKNVGGTPSRDFDELSATAQPRPEDTGSDDDDDDDSQGDRPGGGQDEKDRHDDDGHRGDEAGQEEATRSGGSGGNRPVARVAPKPDRGHRA